jgi:tetratricopeptide (TPR) repeat protein
LVLLEEQRKLEASYQELVAEADNLYQNGHYDLAIKKYAEAQAVKSIESYPEERIAEIRKLLLDAEKQREIDEKYNTQIILAVRLFSDGNLEEAKKAYENALELKPYEEQPKQQIYKIDSTVNARIMAAEIQRKYLGMVASGDSLMELLAYDAAIQAYESAIAIKPDGKEADQKLLTARTTKSNYERALERQANYDAAIRKADELFGQKSYELAQTEYMKASEIKIDEPYPKQQLDEIAIILKRLEAEKEQRYKDAIVKADNAYEQANFQEAVIQYKIAASIKPAESYPKGRIEECNSLLAEQLRKIKNQYDLAIADADKLYASKIYDKAIKAYQDAEQIKPDETYPREMITKITKYIEENAIVDVVNKQIAINSGVTEKFSFEPIRINVRKSNYVLVKARNLGENEFKIIFTYGSAKGKNGGFVVQVPQGQEYNDFIIRVGNQYKWFSEDNDWLSIYPENGDIEIKLVRISTSN